MILTARMNHSYSHVWQLQQPSSSSRCYYLSTHLDSQSVCHGVIWISESPNLYQFLKSSQPALRKWQY